MKMNNNNNNFFIIFVLCCTLILIFAGFFFSQKKKNKLKTNILEKPILTIGIITGYEHRYKSTASYYYAFEFKGEKISSNSTSSSLLNNYVVLGTFIIGKSFPVIFNSDSPKVNKILIVPDDFKEFNIPFPDSLRWVEELLN